jgi:hypothetical protein
LLKCGHCNYEWEYRGRLARASCPSCGQKVKISVPSTDIGAQMFHRRSSGVLGSPLRAELPPESGSAETTTIGQEIDAVLGGLSQKEREKLREILVPQAKQLAQLIMSVKGEGNEAK